MAIVLFANAFLFPVVFIYIGNVDYFASPFTQFLRLFAGLFAVVLLVIMLLSIICGRRQRQAVNLTVSCFEHLVLGAEHFFWFGNSVLWMAAPSIGNNTSSSCGSMCWCG